MKCGFFGGSAGCTGSRSSFAASLRQIALFLNGGRGGNLWVSSFVVPTVLTAMLGAVVLVSAASAQTSSSPEYPNPSNPGDVSPYGAAPGYGQSPSYDPAAAYNQQPSNYDQYGNPIQPYEQGAGGQVPGSNVGNNGANGTSSGDINSSAGFPSTTGRDQAPQTRGRVGEGQVGGLRAAARRAPLTEFQRVVAESTGHVLPIFGAEMFNSPPSTFAPVDNVPVTPDYVIGPGDELRLLVWGQVNLRGSYVVDRTGAIALPQVGTVHVAGLPFARVADFLKAQMGRVYRNFDLNVNLGQLRSIQVFVVGKARQPGSYTIGSMSTLLNALFASGGPEPLGSLRDIQLKRNGQTVVHFDLYDLLLHGDKSKDVPLASGDVIFIPDVGPQVAVLGSVKSPGIYEVRSENTLQEVLALAGGQTNVAAGSGATVERISGHTEREVINFDLKSSDSPPVQDGDVLIVNSIVDRFKDAVTLRGNVANPGRYAWHPGMRVSDLIPDKESLVTRSYHQRKNMLAEPPPEFLPATREASSGVARGLSSQMQSDSTPNAQGMLARTTNTAPPERTNAGVNGGGNSAGTALTASNSNFPPKNDVVLSAPDIDWDYAVIERQSRENLTTSLLSFNLGKVVLDKDQSQNLELLSGDVVTIFSKADIRVPSERQTKFVKLEGEFAASGIYSVLPGETLRQLLVRAGGFTPDAYLFASEFTRDSVRRLQRQRLLEYADSLESEITAQSSAALSSAVTDRDAAAAQASAEQARASLARLRQAQPSGRVVLELKPDSSGVSAVPDIALEDGDRFIVPKKPSSVSVVGQVYSANAFLFEPNRRVKDYLHLAGGPDRMSDRKREFILRVDGSVISHQYASSRHFGDFDGIHMLPGDTIVVPPKVERGATLRDISNIANILQGFGIAAAAIQVLR